MPFSKKIDPNPRIDNNANINTHVISNKPMPPRDDPTTENNNTLDSPLHYYSFFSRLGVYPDPEAHQAVYDLLVTFRNHESYGRHLKNGKYNIITSEFFRWQRWADALFGECRTVVNEKQKTELVGFVDEVTRTEYKEGCMEGKNNDRLQSLMKELWREMHFLLYEQPQEGQRAAHHDFSSP